MDSGSCLFFFAGDSMFTFLQTGSTDAAYNLAFEEVVLTCKRTGDFLLLWQNRNAVVLGKNQNVFEEVDLTAAEKFGITVVRRITGGGAVYHDLGNINFSLIRDAKEPVDFEEELKPVTGALHRMGIPVEVSGRNDILLDGKKISGTAKCIRDGRLLFHGTLLFDSDLELLSDVLRVDPEKLRSKSIRSVKSRVTNIREHYYKELDTEGFYRLLADAFAADGLCPGSLSPEELSEVERLRNNKYASRAWTVGDVPEPDVLRRKRWDGGLLEVFVYLDRDTIRDIRFFGDYLSTRDCSEVSALLAGCPFEPEEISARLEGVCLQDYFDTITKEQFLDTVFGR